MLEIIIKVGAIKIYKKFGMPQMEYVVNTRSQFVLLEEFDRISKKLYNGGKFQKCKINKVE